MKNEIQPNLSLPPIVNYKEEPHFWYDFFSILVGLFIVGGLIAALIYQHYLYDELRFKNCEGVKYERYR